MKAWRLGLVVLASLTALLSAGTSARGDVIYLVGGMKAEGRILSRDGESVKLQSAGKIINLPLSRIERIEEGEVSREGLAQARRLTEAGRLDAAYQAYLSALADPEIAPKARTEARADMRTLRDRAKGEIEDRYRGML
ncbi:MAG TPA: hypothetical protein VM492_10235, partial [Sumerlaeia bacterium]|nr:hypothetical protein [Sumerlaeia bacterium]